MLELEPDEMVATLKLCQRLGEIALRDFECDGWHLLQNNGIEGGQSVGHFHWNLFPRYAGQPYFFGPNSELPVTDPTEHARQVTVIRAALSARPTTLNPH